jgi:hypothetical protein
MASMKRLEKTLREMPLNKVMWLDIPTYDLFVEREKKDVWTFQLGVEQYIHPIVLHADSDDEEEIGEVDINLPKDPIHSQLSSKIKCYHFALALDTLRTFVLQTRCMKCHKNYSTYSPHDKLCGNCYMKIKTYDMTDKCVICLKQSDELEDSLVKLCEKCSNPVCFDCYRTMIHGKTDCNCNCSHMVQCPCCRDRNLFGELFLIESKDKKEDTKVEET